MPGADSRLSELETKNTTHIPGAGLKEEKDEAPRDSRVLKECISVTRLDHALLRLPDEHFSLGPVLHPPPTLPNRRLAGLGVSPLSSLSPCGDRTTFSLSTGRGGITQVG